MASKSMQQKPRKRRMANWLLAVVSAVVGVVLLASAYVILTDQALQSASKTAQDTIAFARQSVQSYEQNITSSRTKSVMEVWEKISELNERFDMTDSADIPKIEKYLDNMTMDAVVLLDSKLELVSYAGDLTAAKAVASSSVESERLDQVGGDGAKSYLSRVTLDGNTYDCASCGTTAIDGGILVGINRVEEGDLSNENTMLNSLFTSFNFSLDGSIAVTNDSSVVSSNKEELLNMDLESFNVQLDLSTDEAKQGLAKGEYGGSTCFGVKIESSGYDVYVWFPASAVMQERNVQLAGGIVLYLLVILVFFIARINVQNSQLRRERAYMESLERANMAKTDFLRRMSHDVRTPINGIRGLLAIGDHYADDMQKQAECRSKMWEVSSFLLELVNSALDMNKLESGEMQFEHRRFHLCKVVQSVIEVLQVQTDDASIELNFTSDVEHCHVLGSPVHLRQVLQNIGGNAIKYNRDGGSVNIECHELGVENGRVKLRFTCEDTGIGMSEEFQKRAFEAFAQENSSSRTVYQGTGLGLAISKEIVEQMGGSIELQSIKDEGTIFTVELEFDIDTAAGDSDDVAEDAGYVQTLEGMRVLLAEDNELNCEVATFMLEQAGIKVESVQNGQEALERFKQAPIGHYDMILMDVMMPVMDGFEASRAMRLLARPDAKTIPIIAVTANAFVDDQELSASAGMNAHVSKPLDAQKLLKVMRENRL